MKSLRGCTQISNREIKIMMIKQIITAMAILLNIVQIGFVVYFLMIYTTDNMPLFMFLFIVPLVNILAIILKYKY